eukprot:scaffold139951_cov63-Attheya_sp.AAC.1
MINLRGNARSLTLYRLHVKVCDDEDLQKDEYDDQFSGLLFFIGGVNMGQAPHLKTHAEILPIHADQLFNLGEDGDDCCKFIEKKTRNPKLVKSIQAVYRVLLTGKEGVVEQLFSPYNLWVQASPSPSPSPLPLPSPTLESSSLASLKTSNNAAATLTTSARPAQLSAEITNKIPFDGEGFPNLNAFWDKSVALAMDPSLPPGWPEEKATHKKADAAAILAEVKATPAAVVADAEATKSTNIAALAAYAATKKTKIAEDVATAKHVQEKAAAAVLADAEVTKAANIAKAAEDEAAVKLVQEKAATAAILADAEVTKAANVAAALAKAAEDEAAAKLPAEDEATAKLVQEKAAAAAVLADEKATSTAANADVKLVEEKAALAAEETTKALAANVAEKLAVDEAAAKVMKEDLLRSLQLTVSSDSHDSDTKTDSDTSPEDPMAHAGKDDATAELVQKLAEEDLLRKESPVKSPTKKLTSALKNLESGYIEVDAGKRKRNPTGYLLPSAKRALVLKTDKSKKQTSSSTSKKLLSKESIKKTPLLPKRLHAIVNGKDITFFVKMIKKPVMYQGYRDVVKGSPFFKEHRGAPPEPVGSNILQNK